MSQNETAEATQRTTPKFLIEVGRITNPEATFYGYTRNQWFRVYECCRLLTLNDNYLLDGLDISKQSTDDLSPVLFDINDRRLLQTPMVLEQFAPSLTGDELYDRARDTHKQRLFRTVQTNVCYLSTVDIKCINQIIVNARNYPELFPEAEKLFSYVDTLRNTDNELPFKLDRPIPENLQELLRWIKKISPTLDPEWPFNQRLLNGINSQTNSRLLMKDLGQFIHYEYGFQHPLLDPNCQFISKAIDASNSYKTIQTSRWFVTHDEYRRMLGIVFWLKETRRTLNAYGIELSDFVPTPLLFNKPLITPPMPLRGQQISADELAALEEILEIAPKLDPATTASDLHLYINSEAEEPTDRELDTSDDEDPNDQEEDLSDREPELDEHDPSDTAYTGPFVTELKELQQTERRLPVTIDDDQDWVDFLSKEVFTIDIQMSDEVTSPVIDYAFLLMKHFGKNASIEKIAKQFNIDVEIVHTALLQIIKTRKELIYRAAIMTGTDISYPQTEGYSMPFKQGND